MTLNQTVLDAIHNYSSLFKSRMAFLGYLYFGYGTAYEWVDGRLVQQEKYKETKELISESDANTLIAARLLYNCKKPSEDIPKTIQKALVDAADKLLVQHPDTLRRIAKGEIELEIPAKCLHIENVSCYSPIFNIPKDVKVDFLGGAVETCDYFSKTYPVAKFLLKNIEKRNLSSKDLREDWSSLCKLSPSYQKAKQQGLILH